MKISETAGVSYQTYLQVSRLLGLQKTISQPTRHDELMFIVIHQAFELWFKVVLHELEEVDRLMRSGDIREATRLFNRVLEIEKLLVQQTRVIESMRPMDFLSFRDFFGTSSGLQSLQFREIEFFSGLKDEKFLLPYKAFPEDYGTLKKRLDASSLWDSFHNLLVQKGFKVDLTPDEEEMSERERTKVTMEKEVKAITEVYSSGEHSDIVELAEAFITHDEHFALWRFLHMAMVERMIGTKPGSGQPDVELITGTLYSGIGYLKTTLGKKFFPALWNARTAFVKG